jgi:hypothetical protein
MRVRSIDRSMQAGRSEQDLINALQKEIQCSQLDDTGVQAFILQPLRLVLGLPFFSAPEACAFTFSAALSTGSLISRLPAGVSLCSVVFLLAGAFQ